VRPIARSSARPPAALLARAAGTVADRDRLRWLAAGATTGASVIVVELTLHALVGWPAALVPTAVTAAALPAIAVAASGTPRLAGLGGRALVDTLAAGAFTVMLSAVYLVVVRGLGNAPTGRGDRETLGLSMVAAALAAVSFGPARRRFLVTANRVVFGSRQAPDELIRAFASRLTRSTPMDELLLQLAESLVRTMDLTRAGIYTGSGQVLERAAGVPDRGGLRSIVVTEKERPAVVRAAVSGNAWIDVWLPGLTAATAAAGTDTDSDSDTDTSNGAGDRAGGRAQLRVAPIRNAGELLGLIVVERAAAAEPFSEDDDRILGDLAREVGLALHNMQLDAALQNTLAELRAQAAELRESRARIVASGDAERRRVERNIHDGAQQNLVALAIGLRLARDLLETDPHEAARMLDEMNGEVQNAVAELRELAHGIYPPLLADGGLAPALQAAAARCPLPVEVDVATPARFEQATESAVYFCCLEALQNSAKHAPGATVGIRVWYDNGTLFFQVSDDGPGLNPDATARGHGLVNMTDRLGAIGGTVQWSSQPGQGMEVSGSVPVPTDPARL
jgi:signal transduction histidine kinase